MNLQSCTVLDNKQKTSKKHLSIACLCFHLWKWLNIWDMHKMFHFFICCFIFFYLPFHTCRADTRRLTILGLSWLKLVCWCLTRFISAKKPSKNNTQTFPLLRAPGLWWACWQSEEAALEWTPAGGLHICVRKKRVKINLDQVWLGLARFGLVTSWGQCDWC